MASIFTKLSRFRNGFPAKLLVYLMVISIMFPITSVPAHAEFEGEFNPSEASMDDVDNGAGGVLAAEGDLTVDTGTDELGVPFDLPPAEAGFSGNDVNNTFYTVVYWLEKPNYAGTPEPGNYSQYDFAYAETREGIQGDITGIAAISDAAVNAGALKYSYLQDASNTAILGNATTVVNVFCARNVYIITFDLYREGAAMEYNGVNYAWDGEKYCIYAKYEQYIGDIWPSGANTIFSNYINGELRFTGWSHNRQANSPLDPWATKRLIFTEDMIPSNTEQSGMGYTLTGTWGVETTEKYANFWFESLPGEEGGETTTLEYVDYEGEIGYKTFVKQDGYTEAYSSISDPVPKEIAGVSYVCATSEEADNVKVFNFFYDRNRYTLKFDELNGSYVTVYDVMYGERMKGMLPDDPVRIESNLTYIFNGWYSDSEFKDIVDLSTATMPASELTLYAKWESSWYEVKYYDGTSSSAGLIQTQNALLNDRIDSPYRAGDLIEGKGVFRTWLWRVNDEQLVFSKETPITGNIELFADCQTECYTITYYDIEYGAEGEPQLSLVGCERYKLDDEAQVIQGPADRADFAGWRINGEDSVYYPGSTIKVSQSIAFVARYLPRDVSETVTLKYYSNYPEGENVSIERLYSRMDTSLKLLDSIEAAWFDIGYYGYELKAWTLETGGEAIDLYTGWVGSFDELIPVDAHEIILYGKWEKVSNNEISSGGSNNGYYTVTFDSNGGEPVRSIDVSNGAYIAASVTPPARTGYTFIGWNKTDGKLWDFGSDQVTGDLVLVAVWQENSSGGGGTADSDNDGINRDDRTAEADDNVNISDAKPPLAFITDHIQYIYGYPDGSVKPDSGITRAEAAAIFHRLLANGDKNDFTMSTFSDLVVGDWYYQPIAYLEKNGILLGYPDGTFHPNETVTRAEYAAIASRFDELVQSAENKFVDVSNDYWAVGFINSAAAKGWVTGDEDGYFAPYSTITRAQVVTIINRMLHRAIRLENVPVDVRGYSDLSKSHWAYCAIIEASDTHAYELTEGDTTEIWVGRMTGL